jgi:hypothetical protein
MAYLSKPSVVWQKWKDPFMGSDDNDLHETLEDLLEEPSFVDDINDDKNDSNLEDSDLDNNEQIIHKQQVKAIITPMGIVPYDEYNSASKIFNFWIGHTNFNISKPVSQIIENIEGVETLDIFTRYRFRIGIAKLFKPSEVMSSITNSIYGYLDEHG